MSISRGWSKSLLHTVGMLQSTAVLDRHSTIVHALFTTSDYDRFCQYCWLKWQHVMSAVSKNYHSMLCLLWHTFGDILNIPVILVNICLHGSWTCT